MLLDADDIAGLTTCIIWVCATWVVVAIISRIKRR